MPAEIDTGGPRVLHCDYRADCPIPIVASTESSLRRDNRAVRASIARRLPRIDSNLSLDGGATKSRRLPSRRAGSRGSRRGELNVPRVADASQDVQEDASCPELPESRLRGVVDEQPPGNTVTKRWRFRPLDPSRNRFPRGNDGERGRCSKRDFSAENWPQVHAADCVRIGKALFSSQSRDRTYEKLVPGTVLPSLADETWKEVDSTNSRRRESRVAKVAPSVRQTEFQRDDVSARCSRGTRKKRRECPNGRTSCIRLAFLLFLVAFGQCGLRKSSAFNCSARPSAGALSVFAIGTVISAVSAAPVDLTGDAGVRAERSANLSHITGASRKIQMYIKNRHLQILPDGTVNGSNDDTSDYTIFQRSSVSRGQLRIQGVATCLYLCMDSCGLLYGSREYTDDCVFNETLEQHNYNTYSSAKWSTTKKTLYLGLNRRGQPRRVQAKGHNLGRLSAYARVLTQVASSERVEALQRRMLGAHHNVRHRHHSHRGDMAQQSLCPTLPVQEKDGRDKFRCRKRKKRKKRKRRCRPGEKPGPQCQIAEESNGPAARGEGPRTNGTSPESKRSCEGAASEEACRREALTVPSKKRKLRVEEATDGPAGGRNVTASNGKSKPPASNAKKVSAAGSMSQSKKPNLTDGKKKKKKGPPARRKPAVALGRKRFTPGGTGSTYAARTATSAPTYATSSSSWSSPGASTVPSGRGASPRRRTKPPFPAKNELGVSRALARNRTRTIDRGAIASTYETTTMPDRTTQTATLKVPETVSERSFRSPSRSSAESIAEDDDDPSSTVSNEPVALDSTTAASIETTGAPTNFRSPDDEPGSLGDADNPRDSDRLVTPETVTSTTPEISLESLAM